MTIDAVTIDGWSTATAGHREFRLRVSAGGHSSIVCHRYSSFVTLHTKLRTLASSSLPANLPAPKLLSCGTLAVNCFAGSARWKRICSPC